jgi:hypothetical protein
MKRRRPKRKGRRLESRAVTPSLRLSDKRMHLGLAAIGWGLRKVWEVLSGEQRQRR